MKEETRAPENSADEAAARGYRLLHEAGSWPEVTVRDDQQEFAWLLDAARVARGGGRRFRLVDSGKLEAFSLEWLASSGADLYTADDIRPNAADLIRIRAAGRPSGAVTAFFYNGPLTAGQPADGRVLEMLKELLRGGVDVHVSNRERPRPPEVLLDLAAARRPRWSEFVYYHHGALIPDLEPLAGAGSWVHLGDAGFDLKTHAAALRDICRAGRRAGAGLALHLEKQQDRTVLGDIRRAGAFLLHKFPLAGSLVERSLPPRAFYLDTTFMS